MDAGDFLQYIIIPSTMHIKMHSKASDMLLLGTAMVESGLQFLEQKGAGTALGVYQIESSTHYDVQRYLNRSDNKITKNSLLAACFYDIYPSDDALMHNLRYTTLIARIKYWMIPEPLPEYSDAKGLASYHKRFYNTSNGATLVEESVKIFQKVIDDFQG
jgi:hypothetical protein